MTTRVNDSDLAEAFFTVCNEAKPAQGHYVSLYVDVPFYGGPEEGGWWGHDCSLVAYQWCSTEEEVEAKREAVEKLAKEKSEQAKREFGEHCLRQTEWLEARGLDDSFLPEVDGEERYYVVIEDTPGSQESQGCRHYE